MLRKLKLLILKYKNGLRYYFSSSISSKTLFGPRVQIFGISNVCIKDNCTIGENTLFTVNDRSNDIIQLQINENCYIGRDNFFSVGKSIVIGAYCIFGNKCSFICSDHIFDNPLTPFALSGNSFTKSIKIGTNCWLGHDVSIIGNVKIGHGCIIGAKTLITKDIPPFSMVVGNPARIVKRYNFVSQKWEKNNAEFSSEYYDEAIYLDYLIKNSEIMHLGYHSASSKYGHL